MQKQNIDLNEQCSQFIKRLKYINMINQPKQEYFNVVLSKIRQVKDNLRYEQQDHKSQQIEQNKEIKQQIQQQQYQKQAKQAQNKMIPELDYQQDINVFDEQINREKKYQILNEAQQNKNISYQNNYSDRIQQPLYQNNMSSPNQNLKMEFNPPVHQHDLNREDSFDQINAGYLEFNQNQILDLKPRNLANQFKRHSILEQAKKHEHIQLQREILEEKDHKQSSSNNKIKQHVKTQQEQLENIQNNQKNQSVQPENNQNQYEYMPRQQDNQKNASQNINQYKMQSNQQHKWKDQEIEILTECLGYLKIDTTQVEQFFQNLTQDYNQRAQQKGFSKRSYQDIFEKIKHDSFLIYKHEKQKEKKTYKHLIEKSLTSFI
ncbi:hypothetical protein ABPG74_009035 [Tetrahymena malaccensis]